MNRLEVIRMALQDAIEYNKEKLADGRYEPLKRFIEERLEEYKELLALCPDNSYIKESPRFPYDINVKVGEG